MQGKHFTTEQATIPEMILNFIWKYERPQIQTFYVRSWETYEFKTDKEKGKGERGEGLKLPEQCDTGT